MLFPVDKNLVFTSRNEGLAEKYVPVEEETAGNSWLLSEKIEEHGFHWLENQFSLVKICSFF